MPRRQSTPDAESQADVVAHDKKTPSVDLLTVLYLHDTLPPAATQREGLMGVMADGSVWRMRDLERSGFNPATIRRCVADGSITAISRGLYRLRDAAPVHGLHLAEVAARVPELIICLSSAAHFHGLLDAEPAEVWGAIPNSKTTPKLDGTVFRPIRWRASEAREVGIQEHVIAGVPVRITDPARTAVDMVRMAEKVGEKHMLACLRTLVDREMPVAELEAIADALGLGKQIGRYLRMYWHFADGRQEDREESKAK